MRAWVIEEYFLRMLSGVCVFCPQKIHFPLLREIVSKVDNFAPKVTRSKCTRGHFLAFLQQRRGAF